MPYGSEKRDWDEEEEWLDEDEEVEDEEEVGERKWARQEKANERAVSSEAYALAEPDDRVRWPMEAAESYIGYDFSVIPLYGVEKIPPEPIYKRGFMGGKKLDTRATLAQPPTLRCAC